MAKKTKQNKPTFDELFEQLKSNLEKLQDKTIPMEDLVSIVKESEEIYQLASTKLRSIEEGLIQSEEKGK